MRKTLTVLCCLLLQATYGQRLPVEHFNVDKGLSQSQVTCITQDSRNYLWVGTIAGLNRFDGTSFKVFSKKDGINSNSIMALYHSAKGDIWIGTSKGISKYNGYRFENLATPDHNSGFNFKTITEDAKGNIYILDYWNGLFVVKGNKLVQLQTPGEGKSATCLYRDLNGRLWVYIFRNGLYLLENSAWVKQYDLPGLKDNEFVKLLTENNGCYYAVTNIGTLLKIQSGKIMQQRSYNTFFMSAAMDSDNRLWLAASQGVMVVNTDDLSLWGIINAKNGLSDNRIHVVYKDVDQNFWVGSDGDGLYKYSGGPFVKYDKYSGLKGNVAMGFAIGKDGNILVGTREGGLLKYNPVQKSFGNIDYSNFSKYGVNCISADAAGNIYIGTMDNRLLKMDGKHITEIMLEEKYRPGIYTIKPYYGKVLVHASDGGYWVGNDSVQKIEGLKSMVNSIALNEHEILTGSENGLYVCGVNGTVKKLNIPGLKDINISSFEKLNNYIVVSSFDEGLFFWDRETNKVIPCNNDSGLADNNVFAMMKDSRNNLWVGTSSGIQQVAFDKDTKTCSVKRYTVADGYESSEANLNAMIEDQRHNIWIGTTNGVFIYDPALDRKRSSGKPVIVVESVDYPGVKDILHRQLSAWEQLPVQPRIAYENNSISFSFKGIYLRDPGSLLYSYQLDGYDAAFSPLQKETMLHYKGLPPGNYIFRVKAFTKGGLAAANVFEYPFTIITPYYKTIWFKAFIVIGLILIGGLIQIIYANGKRKKAREIRQMKTMEQQRIREQTAEDFHDELGNKLTRISLLADVLEHKTDPVDEEKHKIISQIKSNALSLYSGTKEIIWSLTRDSNDLNDVLATIKQTGIELFSDTDVHFECIGFDDANANVKIPAGYNRNIIMIFKELLSNSMRHAMAKKVIIECRREREGTVGIYFTDNGVGFDKRNAGGNGLHNIRRRAEKIGGTFEINSIKNLGTTCCLAFNVQEGQKEK